jgi:quinol monooxygenase YgiN
MIPLRVTAEFRINPGKVQALVAIVRDLETAVRSHDKGTFIYAWYISLDGSKAFVHEHYESTEAFIDHATAAAELIARLAEVGDFARVTFAGEPSEFVLNMLSSAKTASGSTDVAFYTELS